jgi:hypothetical protein
VRPRHHPEDNTVTAAEFLDLYESSPHADRGGLCRELARLDAMSARDLIVLARAVGFHRRFATGKAARAALKGRVLDRCDTAARVAHAAALDILPFTPRPDPAA